MLLFESCLRNCNWIGHLKSEELQIAFYFKKKI